MTQLIKNYRTSIGLQTSLLPATSSATILCAEQLAVSPERKNDSSSDIGSPLPARGYTRCLRGVLEIDCPVYPTATVSSGVPAANTLAPLMIACGWKRITTSTSGVARSIPSDRNRNWYQATLGAQSYASIYQSTGDDILSLVNCAGSSKFTINTSAAGQLVRANFSMMGNLPALNTGTVASATIPPVSQPPRDFYVARNFNALEIASTSRPVSLISFELDMGAQVSHIETVGVGGYAAPVITGYDPTITIEMIAIDGIPWGEQLANSNTPADIIVGGVGAGFYIATRSAAVKTSTRANSEGLVTETLTAKIETNSAGSELPIYIAF